MNREQQNNKNETAVKSATWREGRLYFTRRMERRIFFGLTLIMLAWGVLVKLGVFFK